MTITGVDGCVFCSPYMEDREHYQQMGDWFIIDPIGSVNSEHRLLIPNRHVERFEDLVTYELVAIPDLIFSVLRLTGASDYNLGINAGGVAGQTVFHLHIHIIPRWEGDVEDPRGGIVTPLGNKFEGSRFNEYLKETEEK